MLPVKRRYIWTKHNTLRLRYVALTAAILCAGGASSYARFDDVISVHLPVASVLDILPEADASVSHSAAQDEASLTESEDLHAKHILTETTRPQVEALARADTAPVISSPPLTTVTLNPGDTLSEALQHAGAPVRDSIFAIRALATHLDPRRIKPGQTLSVQITNSQLEMLSVSVHGAEDIVVTRGKDSGAYEATVERKSIINVPQRRSVTIDSSLYASAAHVGVPPQIIANLIRIYSWSVDFQREIRRGDSLDILYTERRTEEGDFIGYGSIDYAALNVGGKTRPIYRYQVDGHADYFKPNGHSLRKTLMKTPVDGARISSGFGMRHHPILGYNKMHKGMDFAAPTGTPIYAAGDGIVEYVGRRGAYGNYIRLRHTSALKTAYAHLHKFAKITKSGARVRQGDVIGYIGSTGRSTGPHLHYEVLKDNVQVNPNSLDLPVGQKLHGEELAKFQTTVGRIDARYASLGPELDLAHSR